MNRLSSKWESPLGENLGFGKFGTGVLKASHQTEAKPVRRETFPSLATAQQSATFAPEALDNRRLIAYTPSMSAEETVLAGVPCFCGALRDASRAVSRLYDDELRTVGLRITQYSVLCLLRRSGEFRQRDLAGLTLHDETSLSRSLSPLVDARWVAVRAGEDRREKWFTITPLGVAKLEEAKPAWVRAQARVRALLPERAWRAILEILPEVARLTAYASVEASRRRTLDVDQ
jgi:DNA-binding MarR family transcriptional regulator